MDFFLLFLKNKFQVHMLRKLPFKIVVKLCTLVREGWRLLCFSEWEGEIQWVYVQKLFQVTLKSIWANPQGTCSISNPFSFQLFLFYWLILIRYVEVSLILKILQPTLYFMFLFNCSLLSSSLWTSTLKVWCTFFLSLTSISAFLTSLYYVTFLKPVLSQSPPVTLL